MGDIFCYFHSLTPSEACLSGRQGGQRINPFNQLHRLHSFVGTLYIIDIALQTIQYLIIYKMMIGNGSGVIGVLIDMSGGIGDRKS